MPDGEVIDLAKVRDRPPVVRRKRNYKDCQHPSFIVWDPEPCITCSLCEQVLDPYWVLRQFAYGYVRIEYKIKALEDLEEKREERNKKARERRANKKQAGG